jgi:hypothetical protein
MQVERFDVATEAATLAVSVARAIDREQKAEARKRSRPVGQSRKEESGQAPVGPGLVKKSAALQSQVAAAQKLFAEYAEATTKLKSQPENAAAHSAAANYLCFVRGEWQKGLSALAKSDIDGLKKVAATEISLMESGNQDPKQLFELAGAWWSASLLCPSLNYRSSPQQYGLFGKDRGMLADDLAGLLYQHSLIH